MAKAAQPSDTEKLRVNEKKWTKPLWAAGWSGIPNIIIEKQAALGLDPLDMNIILHLTQYWWKADNPPCPSVGTIATALGVTERTIQKRIKALEELHLIERVERRQTKYGSMPNIYKLDGLIAAATPYAQEKLKEIEQAKAAKKARILRKKPVLSVVK
ncbi:HTH domain-containing protein [Mesorhizobium sp. M9A.F.Ca.ET.002.03.1.2]|uniref:helix-turn-helix domain-containing protein n=1 Tax=Mesorhizobium sp. M9A.F.Ca.ET.002.03.1.2 TaxID=2493668 RepID=UPI000F751BDE|nr:helix-turn-helix domain-containing protein [Mesorhizobium sp. M9A.F.Ca.ET.002.03.1.2]AZN99307.1 HTH domain-containing protein [Mesorhizobium sp. M9A.F.Ca.ET.002.03.1.2]